MPRIIDHEERKELILRSALDVFAREGYHNSSLSMIAEETGLSRPTIYQYFHDKKEIYYYAVKLVTGRLFTRYSAMAWDEEIGDEIERMKAILADITREAVANAGALGNLMSVILSTRRDGVDFAEVIQHRTAKISILFKRLLRQGISRKTIRSIDIDKTASALFDIAEDACFKAAFYASFSTDGHNSFAAQYLDSLRIAH